ncbi:MAG: hypothetical protein M0R00_05215 [Candidatus Omnitrophica bacterium]|jgi:hypothetical protein|nr:hypothetical protein [Candidatus Omnitrophota bacterium]
MMTRIRRPERGRRKDKKRRGGRVPRDPQHQNKKGGKMKTKEFNDVLNAMRDALSEREIFIYKILNENYDLQEELNDMKKRIDQIISRLEVQQNLNKK